MTVHGLTRDMTMRAAREASLGAGAIVNIGREDVDVDGLRPIDSRLTIVGASSDHWIIDVTQVQGTIHVGDTVSFALNYSALLAAMTSQYVDKRVCHATPVTP